MTSRHITAFLSLGYSFLGYEMDTVVITPALSTSNGGSEPQIIQDTNVCAARKYTCLCGAVLGCAGLWDPHPWLIPRESGAPIVLRRLVLPKVFSHKRRRPLGVMAYLTGDSQSPKRIQDFLEREGE